MGFDRRELLIDNYVYNNGIGWKGHIALACIIGTIKGSLLNDSIQSKLCEDVESIYSIYPILKLSRIYNDIRMSRDYVYGIW